jgi:hypothetical protein
VLAEDTGLTTFSTWECLFALSVTQRRFWMALGRFDRAIGRPGGRALSWIEHRAFRGLDRVHPMGLDDPEEDYFALMPVLASFILILVFPGSSRLWEMGAFDRDMPEHRRARIMDFYFRCLQRHLHVHGPNKRLLSKNAAFAPLAGALRERFSDAQFIVCLREPEATLPSQLSSIEPGLAFFDVLSAVPDFRERLTRQLAFYYLNLETALGTLPADRCAWVSLGALQGNLEGQVLAIYDQLGLPPSDALRERLRRAATRARAYRSDHAYALEQFGLSRDWVDRELGPVYARLLARPTQK